MAWFAVVAITVVYLVIDHTADGDGRPMPSAAVTVAAVALALVKYRVILREFMDVRSAPPLLQRLTDLLVVVIAAALLGTFVMGRVLA